MVEELTVEEYMEKFPYFKDMSKNRLFVSKNEIEELIKSERIKVDSEDVSIEFLKKIIQDERYFKYALKYFTNDIDSFTVSYIINGDIGATLYYFKSTTMKGIDKLISSGNIILNAEEKQRYDMLKNSISFDRFIEKYKDSNYNIDIDGNTYSIPVGQMISFMQLSEDEFNNLCSNDDFNEINGIPKKNFIYASFQFFKENNVMRDYLTPDEVANNYAGIASFEKIDLEAINKFLITKDTKYKEIEINDDLRHAILEGLPSESSDLEKAIYIYIKMCKLLTYDEEYYAVNQKGVATEKHRTTDFISQITLDNNKVVCFEFNLIYSKLLNELGLNFNSEYKGMVGESYGDSHANLEFRADKFLVSADSVTSILLGDIMQAKLNQPLVGLKCVNKNKQTQQEFQAALTKMYQLIAEQDRSIKNYQVGHVQTLDELLDEYSAVTQNIKEISLEERVSILIDKVNSTKMVGIDSMSYVLQLKKILFTEEQRKNNIAMTIVRNNEPFEEDQVAMPTAIFALNDLGFETNPDQNVYYCFNPNNELVLITKEELQSKFDEGKFEYVEENDPKIPDINENGGIVR